MQVTMDQTKSEIDRIRYQVIDITLIAASLVGAVLLISVALRDLEEDRFLIIGIQGFLLICTIAVTIFRHRISLPLKVYYVMLNLWLTMFAGMYNLGFLASGKIIVMVAPIMVSFLLSFRKAVWSVVLFFALYAVFAFFWISGALTLTVPADAHISNYRSWITDGSLLLMGASMLLFIGYHLQKEIVENLRQVNLKNMELQVSRQELMEHKENLEKLVQEKTMKLVGAEKLASLGMLTAGIAHEINNPLNYISGAYLQLEHKISKQSPEQQEETRELLKILGIGVKKVTEIVRGLNQFSRTNDSLNENCDLHLILENCLMMVNSQTKHRVDINREFRPEGLVVDGNSGKLHQVFLNLLANAAQAIPEKGSITVTTAINPQGKASVSVRDTGSGILPEHLNRIMDPFFTTKPPGQGTGLGLYITQSILNEHGGSIVFRPAPETGTIAEVVLPLTR